MAGVGDHSRSLKEALLESLNAVLSPIHNVRVSGEEQVKALEVTEGESKMFLSQKKFCKQLTSRPPHVFS
jgi:hypothetical protein